MKYTVKFRIGNKRLRCKVEAWSKAGAEKALMSEIEVLEIEEDHEPDEPEIIQFIKEIQKQSK